MIFRSPARANVLRKSTFCRQSTPLRNLSSCWGRGGRGPLLAWGTARESSKYLWPNAQMRLVKPFNLFPHAISTDRSVLLIIETFFSIWKFKFYLFLFYLLRTSFVKTSFKMERRWSLITTNRIQDRVAKLLDKREFLLRRAQSRNENKKEKTMYKEVFYFFVLCDKAAENWRKKFFILQNYTFL